jgi:hypothetical protein
MIYLLHSDICTLYIVVLFFGCIVVLFAKILILYRIVCIAYDFSTNACIRGIRIRTKT